MKSLPKLHVDDVNRVWANIIRRGVDVCWPWVLSTYNGYPQIRIQHDTYRVNRLVFMIHYGHDPSEYDVCHRCDFPKCCNPHHYFLGTEKDNLKDMSDKGRARKSRYSEADVNEMTQLVQSGNSQKFVAAMFDCSASTVSLLVNKLVTPRANR